MILHRIWQDKGKYPHEIYTLPRRWKVFIFASEELVIEAEEEQRKKDERRQQTMK